MQCAVVRLAFPDQRDRVSCLVLGSACITSFIISFQRGPLTATSSFSSFGSCFYPCVGSSISSEFTEHSPLGIKICSFHLASALDHSTGHIFMRRSV